MAILRTLQVGQPATHGADTISKKEWFSGIFKQSVTGAVWLDQLNLVGDGQADLDNHGGIYRAILAYSLEHYPVWESELGRALPYGSFGENFTIEGLDEETVCLGDVYTVGEARLQVSQPRQPCWKLARRNALKDLTARVEQKGWGGWYHQVLQTGYVEAGQPYQLIERPHPEYTIARINTFIREGMTDKPFLRALSAVSALTPQWRTWFNESAEPE